MKSNMGKKILLHMVGFILAGINYMGVYPLGLAYFTAAYRAKVYRLLLFPVMFLSMSISMDRMQLAKYGLCMIVAAAVTSIMELDKSRNSTMVGSIAAGITTAAMGYVSCLIYGMDKYELCLGIGEGVLVFALSEVFYFVIRYIVKDKKTNQREEKEGEEFHYRSKDMEKMEGVAKAFKSLASTFRNLSDMPTNYMTSEVNAISTNMDFYMLQKINTMWSQKLYENRLAIAGQLNEMAHIISDVAKDTYQVQELTKTMEEKLRSKLKSMHIRVQGLEVIERPQRGLEVYARISSKKNKCVMTKDVAAAISQVCGKKMVASKDSKVVVYKEYSPVLFVEDVNFKVMYGAARQVKTGERVSGDNFTYLESSGKKAVLALSDGMGSGLQASQESELVVELLEQFIEAGFCKETAARMINSSMVMGQEQKMYSTIDISEIDLRSGVCEFLKVGAATTFIRRGSWVETIQSTSLPAGMFEQVEFDTTAKKLYDGDYLIMVSDGTLDCIVGENKEQTLKSIIWNTPVDNPRDMAEYILEKITQECEGYIVDDMTVLVAGMWRK